MEIFNSWVVNLYIALRGFHNKENPENSLGAYQRCLEYNYAIECDVHQIEDGTIVCFHDHTLKRLTDKDGYVAQIKSKKDLKNYKLLGTEYTIPTFDELLKLVDGKVPILIEIKNYDKPGSLEKALLEKLRKYKGEYAIQSFNPYVVGWFAENAPEVLRGQLSSYFKDLKMAFYKKFALKRMLLNKKVSKPNFISYDYKAIPNRFVKKYKHLPLLVWAVPSQQAYMKVAKHCDNIIFENFEPRI